MSISCLKRKSENQTRNGKIKLSSVTASPFSAPSITAPSCHHHPVTVDLLAASFVSFIAKEARDVCESCLFLVASDFCHIKRPLSYNKRTWRRRN